MQTPSVVEPYPIASNPAAGRRRAFVAAAALSAAFAQPAFATVPVIGTVIHDTATNQLTITGINLKEANPHQALKNLLMVFFGATGTQLPVPPGATSTLGKLRETVAVTRVDRDTRAQAIGLRG